MRKASGTLAVGPGNFFDNNGVAAAAGAIAAAFGDGFATVSAREAGCELVSMALTGAGAGVCGLSSLTASDASGAGTEDWLSPAGGFEETAAA